MAKNQAHNTIVNNEHDSLRTARRVILTDLNGSPYVASGSGGGGGGGDASAANQLTIISEIQNTNTILQRNGQVLFSESDVASLNTIPVLSYTVPVGKSFKLTKIMCSGNGEGKFILDIGGTVAVKRNVITNKNVDFDFPDDMDVTAGNVIQVLVLNETSIVRHYEITLYGKLI